MNWDRKDDYYMESTTGYRISKLYTGDVCTYYAWGRGVARDMLNHLRKSHYGLNDAVPQERVLLGVFSTAQEAMSACERADKA